MILVILVILVAAWVCGVAVVSGAGSVMSGLVVGPFAAVLGGRTAFLPTLGACAVLSWNCSVLWVAFLLVCERGVRR